MKINFRTWFKPYNSWINSIVVGEHGHIFCYSISMEDNGPVKHNVIHIKDEDAVIEFDTGLKDKNNKEVYEGDIVKVKRCFTRPSVKDGKLDYTFTEGEEELGEVVRLWNNRICVSYEHKRHDDFDDVYDLATHRVEVIGNIHENPEVLK